MDNPGGTACQAAGVDPGLDDPDDEDELLLDGPDVLTSSPCFGGLPDTVCGVDPESDEVEESDFESDEDDDESVEAATPLLPRLSVR